jgi:hypothetical protein
MECNICIEIKNPDFMFNCIGCNYINCIDCHKIYLLSNTLDPHCINCRSTIQYDLFLKKFNKTWIFNQYKKHRYNILWEREQSLLPLTVYYISIKKQEKLLNLEKIELYKKINEIDQKIQLLNISSNNNLKNNFQYTYSCPIDNCKGFLNNDFICHICDNIICKKCYTNINNNDILHICDQSLVDTFNIIKKDSKTCPTCGEFISKISGCDQMFCIKCGTAFSWKTGLIEKGIIHNPHAHTFFLNNPHLQLNYLNNINNNDCRPPIPPFPLFNNANISHDNNIFISNIHRNIAEFRQYFRNRFINYLSNNTDKNQDIRIRFINNDIDHSSFKKILHSRDKKIYYLKQVLNTLINTYEISEIILWNIIDNLSSIDIINNNFISLIQLANDTNTLLNNISDDFNYSSKVSFSKHFKFSYFSF